MTRRHFPPSSTVLYVDHSPDTTRRTWSYRDFLRYVPFATSNGWYSGFHDAPIYQSLVLPNCPIGNVLPFTPPGFLFAQGLLPVTSGDYYVAVMVSWSPDTFRLYEYTATDPCLLVVGPYAISLTQTALLVGKTDLEGLAPPTLLASILHPDADTAITSISFTILAPDGSIHTTETEFALTAVGLFRTFHSRPLLSPPTHPSFRPSPGSSSSPTFPRSLP